METYIFITEQEEIDEVTLNTQEPFENLFISRLPDEDIEIGYEVKDDTVIIKYEYSDGERTMIAGLSAEHIRGLGINSVYGAILKHQDKRKLQVGSDILLFADVRVNSRKGLWHSEINPADGSVVEHEHVGLIFVKTDCNRYQALSVERIKELYHRYVVMDRGQFIPDHYLIRRDGYTYIPMNLMFHLPDVAASFVKGTTACTWAQAREDFINLMESKS